MSGSRVPVLIGVLFMAGVIGLSLVGDPFSNGQSAEASNADSAGVIVAGTPQPAAPATPPPRKQPASSSTTPPSPPPLTPAPTPAPTTTAAPTPVATDVPPLVPQDPLASDRGDNVDRSAGILERAVRWVGKADITPADVPLKDVTGEIPDRVFTTWKSKLLNHNARRYWNHWKDQEPHMEAVIINDTECSVLAGLMPEFKERFDKLPLVVMKADVCRVLAVYYFGGHYKDLDVDWVRPLKHWINRKDGIAYGWEDEEHICQWWFAARPGDPCIKNVLFHIMNLIANTSTIDFNTNVEAVIDITGPGVWTDALQGCPYKPKYSIHEMKFSNIYHDYASQRWSGKEYKSWLDDRKEKAGWNVHWPELQRASYFTSEQAKHLMPYRTDMPPVQIVSARASGAAMGMPSVFGPHLAFDGNMDTAFESNNGARPWFEFSFATPMEIGTAYETPGADRLNCIRMFNRHREPGHSEHGRHDLHMELYDPSGKHFFTVRKKSRLATVFIWYFAGMPANVSRIKIKKEDHGTLTFSELQLFSDPACQLGRRAVVGGWDPTVSPAFPKPLRLVAAIGSPCPDRTARGVSPAMGFQYTHCGPIPVKCNAVILANHKATVDAGFIDSLKAAKCTIYAVAPEAIRISNDKQGLLEERPTTWCNGSCFTADEVRKQTGLTSPPDVAYVEMVQSEWTERAAVTAALGGLGATAVFLPLRMNEKALTAPATAKKLEAMLAEYSVHAFHVNPGEGTFNAGGTYPVELHVSLTGGNKAKPAAQSSGAESSDGAAPPPTQGSGDE